MANQTVVKADVAVKAQLPLFARINTNGAYPTMGEGTQYAEQLAEIAPYGFVVYARHSFVKNAVTGKDEPTGPVIGYDIKVRTEPRSASTTLNSVVYR